MALNPNTDFTAGAVLTASQQNRFPRGLMALVTNDTTDATITVEEVQLIATFTAVANRNYRIMYTEPQLSGTTATTCTARIRQGTTTAGTVLNSNTVGITSITLPFNSIVYSIAPIAAGSQSVVATLQYSAGTGTATRSATRLAYLTVEDLGPA